MTAERDLLEALRDMSESMATIAGISMLGGQVATKLDEARTIASHAKRRADVAIAKTEGRQ